MALPGKEIPRRERSGSEASRTLGASTGAKVLAFKRTKLAPANRTTDGIQRRSDALRSSDGFAGMKSKTSSKVKSIMSKVKPTKQKFEPPEQRGYLIAKDPVVIRASTTSCVNLPVPKKKKEIDRSWRKDYFRVRGGTLQRFTHRGDKAPASTIPLSGAAIGEINIEGRPFCLKIKSGDVLYMFQAETEFEYFTWIVALRGARLYMQYYDKEESSFVEDEDDGLEQFDEKLNCLVELDNALLPGGGKGGGGGGGDGPGADREHDQASRTTSEEPEEFTYTVLDAANPGASERRSISPELEDFPEEEDAPLAPGHGEDERGESMSFSDRLIFEAMNDESEEEGEEDETEQSAATSDTEGRESATPEVLVEEANEDGDTAVQLREFSKAKPTRGRPRSMLLKRNVWISHGDDTEGDDEGDGGCSLSSTDPTARRKRHTRRSRSGLPKESHERRLSTRRRRSAKTMLETLAGQSVPTQDLREGGGRNSIAVPRELSSSDGRVTSRTRSTSLLTKRPGAEGVAEPVRTIAAGPDALKHYAQLRKTGVETKVTLREPEKNVADGVPTSKSRPVRGGSFRNILPGQSLRQRSEQQKIAPRKSGILTVLEKKSFGVFGGSKRRWVELRNGNLSVTKSAARVGHSTKGHNSAKKFCFELVTPSTTRVFAADSGAELLDWITKIQECQAFFMNLQIGYDVKSEEEARQLSGINAVVSIPGNSKCGDCRRPEVKWASINLGIFLCIDCAGVHRSLSSDYSQVRSISMDVSVWTPDILEFMESVGNRTANRYWEHSCPRSLNPSSSMKEREVYITSKYVHKLWADPDSSPAVSPVMLNREEDEDSDTRGFNDSDCDSLEYQSM